MLLLQEALDQFGSWLDENGADEAPKEYLQWLEDTIRSSKVLFGEVSLFDISTNPRAEAGWRAVTKHTMLEKALSYLKVGSNQLPGPRPMLRKSDVEGKGFNFVKGHQRLVSLHKYLQWCPSAAICSTLIHADKI